MPNGEDATGDCRRLHNEEFYYSYSPLNIRVIKTGRIGWAVHVAPVQLFGVEI